MKNTVGKNTDINFNPNPPGIMHIDINSCFATIEQQSNPFLRGRPIAVAAYKTPSGCILAASIEAKKLGIKTGMRVKDGKKISPSLIVLTPDPDKYRDVQIKLRKIISSYTNDFCPQSIDEFVLDMNGYTHLFAESLEEIGMQIKKRIKKEIGDYITVSIGIGTNRFLAKLASNLKKPDGLEVIDKDNFVSVYSIVGLRDFHGINYRYEKRLNRVGIYDPLDFYDSSLDRLSAAFKSINAKYWYLKVHGWEVCPLSSQLMALERDDSVEFVQKSFGNSYALPSSLGGASELLPILSKLTEKTGSRLRRSGYKAQGIHLGLAFKDGSYWHMGRKLSYEIFDSKDIYMQLKKILLECPEIRPVRVLSESVFNLSRNSSYQLSLLDNVTQKVKLVSSIDVVNDMWGEFTVSSARRLYLKSKIEDRISFGGINGMTKGIG